MKQIYKYGILKGYIEYIKESENRFCHMYKTVDGNWYMELAPREYGDRDTADTYGPFSSEESAREYLSGWFSNPGGMGIDNKGTQSEPIKSPNGRPIIKPE